MTHLRPWVAIVIVLCVASLSVAGTIAFWRMEDAPNTSMYGETNAVMSLADCSGNGYTANIESQVHGDLNRYAYASTDLPITPYENGQSLDFGLNRSTDDARRAYVVPHHEGLLLLHSFTWEAFVKFIDQSAFTGGNIFAKVDPNAGKYEYGFEMKWERFVGLARNGINWYIPAEKRLLANRWYHVALVFDESTMVRSYYVDGVWVGEQDITGAVARNTTAGLAVGNYGPSYDNSASWFEGKLDEVRISDVALAPSRFLLNDPNAIPAPGTLLLLL